MRRAVLPIAAAVLALGAAASGVIAAQDGNGRLPKGSETVHLNPDDFTTKIDNPYWPMNPGTRWVYRETDSEGARQKVVVTVTDRTKRIANGIAARVVRDVVTEKGRFVEVTDDWYAQDKRGNVWYLGEDTTEYVNGRPVSKAGSFEAGVEGAQAGVIMPAHPRQGLAYRQEYYKGEAEDRAQIVSLREQAEAGRPLPPGADDPGLEPAGQEDPRVQILRPRDRPSARRERVRRERPRGAGPLRAGVGAPLWSLAPSRLMHR